MLTDESVSSRQPPWRVRSGLFHAFVFLLVPFHLALSAAAWAAGPVPAYATGEVLVKFRDHTDLAALPLALKSAALAPATAHGVRLLHLAEGDRVEAVVAELRRRPDVEYAEPNYLVRKLVSPNDPRFDEQWALINIAATSAWDQHTGSRGVVVAVLDTGVDYTHPDLIANLWQNLEEAGGVTGEDDDSNGIDDDIYGVNYNGTTITGDPLDDDTADAHGTAVSGIIGAVGNNATGIAGVNWTTRLMAVKFLHGPEGLGTVLDAIKGVDYAIAEGARIINMSFAVDGYSRFLEEALKRADAAGVLVVSAAGNGVVLNEGEAPVAADLDVTAVSPASLKTANNISVASSTSGDTLWSLSNYGDATVDLAAPGGSFSAGILSTGLGGYLYLAGTSMAAPHVSGIAALIWSAYPGLGHYEVKARILNSVDPIPSLTATTITGGRVNAVNALVNPTLPAVFTVTPATVSAGGQVTVTGANFGAVAGSVAVGGTDLAVVGWDFDGQRIVATVPATAASGRVQVNGQGSSFPLVVVPATPASSSDDDSDDSRCFIATAAFGSPLHPKVAVLRRFRDEYLLTNAAGRLLVKVYYRLSPPLAELIRESPRLKQAVAWTLTPVVAGAERLLALGARPPAAEPTPGKHREVLVRFKDAVPEARRLAIVKKLDAELVEVQSPAGIYRLRLREGQERDAVIQQLLRMEEVEVAEPNWRAEKAR